MDKKPLAPAAIVIFGITGDLAHRKLLPALYYLTKSGLLPDGFEIIGVTRSGTTTEAVIDGLRTRVETVDEPADQQVLDKLEQSMRILTLDLADASQYAQLKQELDDHEKRVGTCTNRLFYLAIPSQTFGDVSQKLAEAGLTTGCDHHVGESRLLIEKPFGYDLSSARSLIDDLSRYFTEQQMYRVDHYLAKETAQNILIFRFHNPVFQAVWNSGAIESVMLTAAESIGIEGRVGFYQQTGALRDVLQSHLIQLLAVVAMAQPDTLSADAIHTKKLELLRAIKPITPEQVATYAVRGQYEGYRGEVQDQNSTVETYAAVRLDIDTPTWRGVPFLLRTGKALADKVTEITLSFRGAEVKHRNTLTLRIQPNEGISIELQAKKPGFDDETRTVQMDYCYEQTGQGVHPDAYERVLVDALRGDKTLFATSDEIIASWEAVEAVVQAWQRNGDGLEVYPQGSWGPASADQLAVRADTAWISDRLNICQVHNSVK